MYTLPHEFNFAGTKSLTQSDYCYFINDYDYQNKNRKDFKDLMPRRRSKSDEDDEFINNFNIKTKFGLQYYEVESKQSKENNLGPLKIIKLPSNRSVPKSDL